jgi:hypothetical protein
MSEDEIRRRLASQGFTSLAEDPDASAKIMAAAKGRKLGSGRRSTYL